MINKRRLLIVFTVILVIISINLFDLKMLLDGWFKYIRFLFLLFTAVISLPYLFQFKGVFVLPLQLITISIILSLLMAYYTWDQGIMDSLISTTPYLIWVFYFFLKRHTLSIAVIEKIIVGYGILYMLLYTYQYLNVSTVYFGYGEEIIEERGVFRFILTGLGFLVMTIFISINKITSLKRVSLHWYVLAVSGFLIIILQATRQNIVIILLLIIYHFTRSMGMIKKSFLIILTLLLLFNLDNLDNEIVQGLISAQKTTVEQGEDYIRVLAGEYFLLDFSPNLSSRILGNGVPYGEKSDYGKFVKALNEYDLFYLEDVGIISVYALFGVLAFIGFVLIWIKSFLLPLPKRFNYLKYYLWYLLFTSLTSNYTYHYSFIVVTVFAIYCFDTIYLYNTKVNQIKRLNNIKIKR
ncbi:hypothetical protein [Sediminicola sp. 1XM1-17]|uniref:hypothetical protein n=1 Tax=Sediminicola sp. 1XM1-17 TaxID=3127702 RepID=UPI003076C3E4